MRAEGYTMGISGVRGINRVYDGDIRRKQGHVRDEWGI